MSARKDYTGPALFSYGFRPFFLSAIIFALGVIPVWMMVWQGRLTLAGPFAPTDWHVHEMVFGYGAAVVAGFLFTAVPNWTGTMPTRGWPLMVLLALWVAGRLAMAGGLGLGPLGVMVVDCAFLLAVFIMIAREIVAGRNWRNLKVLVPVGLLCVANAAFHAEVMTTGIADTARRMGIALLIFLVMLIGGRIIPSFTRNWLAKTGTPHLPVPFGRFDAICIAAGAIALVAWVAEPFHPATGVLASLAAVLHLVRLSRWRGIAAWRSPLLLILHIAYLFVPGGMIGVALGGFGLAGGEVAAHLFGIGAVGSMTVAVMMRATMGHTGRDLVAGPALTLAFALVAFTVAARLAGQSQILGGMEGLTLAAWFWTAGFGILLVRMGPWLALPKAARKKPNPRAGQARQSAG